jgi:hypothetical protein
MRYNLRKGLQVILNLKKCQITQSKAGRRSSKLPGEHNQHCVHYLREEYRD